MVPCFAPGLILIAVLGEWWATKLTCNIGSRSELEWGISRGGLRHPDLTTKTLVDRYPSENDLNLLRTSPCRSWLTAFRISLQLLCTFMSEYL